MKSNETKFIGAPQSRLLKAVDLAEQLNIAVGTVRVWLKEGKIKASINHGRVLRFNLQSVLNDLSERGNRSSKSSLKSWQDTERLMK
jgi:hypothetical protein